MEKITNFMKTYWWIWLILLVASSLFLIFGASAIFAIGSFLDILDKLMSGIFTIAFLVLIWLYTFGKEHTKSWGVFRILGIFGVLLFGFTLYLAMDGKKNLIEAQNDPRFNFASLGLFFSLLLFVLGEIFLYLDNLQNSIKNIEAKNLSKENASNSMTCPRCYGKGFVDLNDIKRLGMEQEWGQGFCRYCEGEGEVEKGKTKIQNPLRTDIGPVWHESDIL
jgi:hypothetical protein